MMENPNNKSARNTHTTLKECLNDPNWLKMYDIIVRDTKIRLKNHWYDD